MVADPDAAVRNVVLFVSALIVLRTVGQIAIALLHAWQDRRLINATARELDARKPRNVRVMRPGEHVNWPPPPPAA